MSVGQEMSIAIFLWGLGPSMGFGQITTWSAAGAPRYLVGRSPWYALVEPSPLKIIDSFGFVNTGAEKVMKGEKGD